MNGRVHSPEFKRSICQQIETGAKRPAQICREYNLATSLIKLWRKEYGLRGPDAFEPEPKAEIEKLRRRVADLERFSGQLALENTILKKGLAHVPSRNDTP